MNNNRVVSKYKQSRSVETQKQILQAAEEYMCLHGYMKASVKEIAKHAGVSTGSVYFYFKDKEGLLIAINKIQNNRFIDALNQVLKQQSTYEVDQKKWLEAFVDLLFETYAFSGKLKLELPLLSDSNPHIAEQRSAIKEEALKLMKASIEESIMFKDLKTNDLEMALKMVIDVIDAVYDRMIREGDENDRTNTIKACTRLIYNYLFLDD